MSPSLPCHSLAAYTSTRRRYEPTDRAGTWVEFFRQGSNGDADEAGIRARLASGRGGAGVTSSRGFEGGEGDGLRGRAQTSSVDSVTLERVQKELRLVTEEESLVQLVQERHEQTLTLNRDMLELNSTFKEVARLVDGQGGMVERIEEDNREALDRTKKGLEDLEVARKHQRGCVLN